MKNENKHITNTQNEDWFLKHDSKKESLAKKHKEYLGLDVPENYFNQSKANILKTLPKKNQKKTTVFGLKSVYVYPIAASVILLLGMFFWMMQSNFNQETPKTITVSEINIDSLSDQDVLVSSLMIDDSEINTFLDDIIVEKILVQAELSEQQMEDLFINSLFIEDTLIDSYLERGIINHIVL